MISYHNTEDISLHPSAFLYNVLYRDSYRRDELAQLSDTSRPVANCHLELDQSLFGCQPSLQAAAEDCSVDIAAREDAYHSEIEKKILVILKYFASSTAGTRSLLGEDSP